MNDSILYTIKKLLGIDPLYPEFDLDIVLFINSAIATLRQIGFHREYYSITGSSETWSDYLGERADLELIKTYIYLKVRTMFDPPASGTVSASIDNLLKETECRISYEVDPGQEED